MYSTTKEAFAESGPCPASHPVRVPQVAYETLWDTTQFNNMWPKDGSNPFVLSYGDNKGYGTHADYLFGWKGDSLQKAMDNSCMFQACENGKPLKSQNVAAMNKCQVKSVINEDIDGCESLCVFSRIEIELTTRPGLTDLPGKKMEKRFDA
jgi:hypothetical protein